MSQQNLEVVRAMIDRFNRDGFLSEELFDPDVQLFNIREYSSGPYRGYDGLRQWREGVFETVEEGRFEIVSLQGVGEGDVVVCRMRFRGRASQTHLMIDIGWTNVNWLREGRIYRCEAFTNHEEALEAAGARE
jgi:hypothetical protein